MPESPSPGEIVCPACHVVIDRHALLSWGDGQHTLPCAPWICATCAALGLIALATGHVTITPDAMWQPVRERNPGLWQEIVTIRARIKGDPHA